MCHTTTCVEMLSEYQIAYSAEAPIKRTSKNSRIASEYQRGLCLL
ncbi:hypothetical protein PPIS_a1190 [Pseudoalteromonas piscicida]|uniref:Uncharacterized protein n=1 Tax=Pseudoalteromonas piscicida TaxID=43662 RepID=A0ABN5CAF3_PSEO7|nr:hypothetical protein PPIS_a1190 [Pseudoalteromonas piscicida]